MAVIAEAHGNGVAIYPSPGKSLLLLMCAVAFVVVGIALIAYDPMDWHNRNSGLMLFFGLFCVLVFGTGAIAIFIQMTRRGPAIIIDEYGIWDARVSNGFIPWSDIRHIQVHNLHRHKFLGLDVDNPELYVVGGARRLARGLNERAGYSRIQITLTALKAKPEAIIGMVQGYHERHRIRSAHAAE